METTLSNPNWKISPSFVNKNKCTIFSPLPVWTNSLSTILKKHCFFSFIFHSSIRWIPSMMMMMMMSAWSRRKKIEAEFNYTWKKSEGGLGTFTKVLFSTPHKSTRKWQGQNCHRQKTFEKFLWSFIKCILKMFPKLFLSFFQEMTFFLLNENTIIIIIIILFGCSTNNNISSVADKKTNKLKTLSKNSPYSKVQ